MWITLACSGFIAAVIVGAIALRKEAKKLPKMTDDEEFDANQW